MRTSTIRLIALTALVSASLTGLPSPARAEQRQPSPVGKSFGSGDVQAAVGGAAGLTYCNADDLAHAGDLPPDRPCMVNATQAYAQASAEAIGSVTLFGSTKSLAVATSATIADGTTTMELVVTAFGTVVADVTHTGVTVSESKVFEEHKSYGILGVSVDVTGEVAATVSARIGGGAISNGIQVTVTPTIDAIVVGSAGVSALCASAGVDGSIDALDIQAPTSLSVSVANGQLTYGVISNLDYAVLDGDLKVKASVCGVSESETIASYSGTSGRLSLDNDSGTLSL
jgi:hypothetical protein